MSKVILECPRSRINHFPFLFINNLIVLELDIIIIGLFCKLNRNLSCCWKILRFIFFQFQSHCRPVCGVNNQKRSDCLSSENCSLLSPVEHNEQSESWCPKCFGGVDCLRFRLCHLSHSGKTEKTILTISKPVIGHFSVLSLVKKIGKGGTDSHWLYWWSWFWTVELEL